MSVGQAEALFTCLPKETSYCYTGDIDKLIRITKCTYHDGPPAYCTEAEFVRDQRETCTHTTSSCSLTVDVKQCVVAKDDYGVQIPDCELATRNVTVGCCMSSGPNACGGGCSTGDDCQSGLSCSGGVCVNASCPADTDCVCDGGGGVRRGVWFV